MSTSRPTESVLDRLASAAVSGADAELDLLARFGPVAVVIDCDGERRVVRLGRPSEHSDEVTLRGTAADWTALLDPAPSPGLHDLLSLGKSATTFTVSPSLEVLVRNLRILNRFVEVARETA
ncbi:DUF4419 domain-containing protein [Streptomyces sp. HNM0575]|uniref:hypothetical protein n=1 Tax=Streptomyces sp. HNM0575 TaxID=2716338 RepID=UPI00145CB23C|nr:hypothetical protein [Streptomyces sp. HNM0575]NLU71882.1 DUF4419 domain-containing protein [Streptomyces sp. HNM0575]